MTVVLVAVILTVAAVVALVRLPILHPAQLWLLPWAAATVLNALHLLPYRSLSWTTVAVILGGSAAFVAGTLMPWPRRRRSVAGEREPSFDPALARAVRRAALGAAALTGLALLVFLVDVARRFGVRAALVSSMDVRGAIGEGTLAATIKYIYLAMGAVVLALAAAGLEKRAGRSPRAWVVLGLAMAATVYFGTGRATIVGACIAGAVTYTLTSGVRVSKPRFVLGLGASGVLALLVLIGGGQLIGKTVANNPDVRAVPSFFTRHEAAQPMALAYHYAAAPIAALDVEVGNTSRFGRTDGCAVLTPVCQVAARLGFDVRSVPSIRPFTARPFVWNTYTGLDGPLKDGGLAFFALIVGVVGLIVGAVWRAAVSGEPRAVMIYGLLSIGLMSSYSTFAFTAPHLLAGMALAVALPTALLALDRRRRGRAGAGT